MANIVFMGTPDFAVPALTALIASDHRVSAVVTQPDRRAGRGRKLKPPPVKVTAEAAGIPVYQPERLRGEFADQFEQFAADLAIVAAYGRILGPRYLAAPRHGCVNIHASLLPRLRGAAPIQWSIINGDAETGVSIMEVVRELDAGGVFLQARTPIREDDTAGTLHDRLAVIGAEALMASLPDILADRILPEPQDSSLVTYAPTLTKRDAWIDWSEMAENIVHRVRGLSPWPVAQTRYGDTTLRIHGARVLESGAGSGSSSSTGSGSRAGAGLRAGFIIDCDPARGVTVQAGDGAVLLTKCQAPGRKALPIESFLRGFEIEVGHRLGE